MTMTVYSAAVSTLARCKMDRAWMPASGINQLLEKARQGMAGIVMIRRNHANAPLAQDLFLYRIGHVRKDIGDGPDAGGLILAPHL